MKNIKSSALKSQVVATVVVAALGYFVDIYDLLIFSILRVSSLRSLNVPPEQMLPTGLFLLNMQMAGILCGGIFWGVLGDKRGRLSVLLGSIFLYSTANIANGFVHSVNAYGFWRLVAGVGLAGELGAGITLVSELLPKETRGVGTTIVATIGVAGAVFAALVAEHLSWRHAYFVGGGLGLMLLTLRVAVRESGMFSEVKSQKGVKRGDLYYLVANRERFFRYARCILVGLPTWYVIGILVTFAPEFAKSFGVTVPVSAGRAVMSSYFALVFGDFTCGMLSQYLKSRKKVLAAFLIFAGVMVSVFLSLRTQSPQLVYLVCLPLGFSCGFWSVFVTNAAEQFGTNLRATVAITVPNFARGALIPITWLFDVLKAKGDILISAWIVGVVCIAIALLALKGLDESFGKDLNYVE